jgi:hypothetical protein
MDIFRLFVYSLSCPRLLCTIALRLSSPLREQPGDALESKIWNVDIAVVRCTRETKLGLGKVPSILSLATNRPTSHCIAGRLELNDSAVFHRLSTGCWIVLGADCQGR